MNRQPPGPRRPQMPQPQRQRPNMQQIQQQMQQKYTRAMSSQDMLAAAGCVVGGAIVVLLSLAAGAGDVSFLATASYGWLSLVLYVFVVAAGLAIWREIPMAIHGAAGLIGLDFGLSVLWVYLDTGFFPSWMVFLKVVIFFLVIQALRGDDDEVQQGPPGPGYGPPGPGPGPRGPMPRQNFGPPGPRR